MPCHEHSDSAVCVNCSFSPLRELLARRVPCRLHCKHSQKDDDGLLNGPLCFVVGFWPCVRQPDRYFLFASLASDPTGNVTWGGGGGAWGKAE